MKKVGIATIVALVVVHLGHAGLSADSGSDKSGKKKGKPAAVRTVEGTSVDVHVVFSNRDVQVIREYYAPRYRRLPPGLQKKYARTGTLPPGWQKKMEPFPVVVERELVVLPRGYRRGVLDGHAVIYRPDSQLIIDVAVLF
jgi:hypothetical protein